MKNQEDKRVEFPLYEEYREMSFEQLKETYNNLKGIEGGLENMFHTPVEMMSLVAWDKLKCKEENKSDVLNKIESFVTESEFILELEDKGKILTFEEGVDLFRYIVDILNESYK